MLLVPTKGSAGGGGGHTAWVEKEFSPSNGQVTFILDSAPTDSNSLTFEVNGIMQDDLIDFTISGVTITWLDNDYTMQVADKVHVRYQ